MVELNFPPLILSYAFLCHFDPHPRQFEGIITSGFKYLSTQQVFIGFIIIVIQYKNKIDENMIERFLIRSGGEGRFRILFRMFEGELDVYVIGDRDELRYFRVEFKGQSLPGSLSAYFDSNREMFEYFKVQKQTTVLFKPDFMINGEKKHVIEFQIPVGIKVMRKSFALGERKTSQGLYRTIELEIGQLENVDVVRARVEQKKARVKQMNRRIKQIQKEIADKESRIWQTKEAIKKSEAENVDKKAEIYQIRKDYQEKNKGKYLKQQKTVMDDIQRSQMAFAADPSASMIYDTMLDSYELNPMGKHVMIHNGKRNLFLKEQKEITDDQIKSMEGFDWSEIEVLSFGGNKLTNETTRQLGEISDWENVTELYLFANPITNITKIRFLGQLTKLSLYDLSLDEASCDFLLKIQFPKLNELYLDFDSKVREKCWKKIAESGLKNFTVLESLYVDNPMTISQGTKQKLQQVCQKRNIQCKFGNPNTENCVIY